MAESHAGGVALVTGAYRGIGLEVARHLARRGFTVVRSATLPDNGPTGGFFRDGQPLP